MVNESTSLIPANYLLEAGFIFVATKPTVISVALGSSVAVSIYDKKRRVGGMNHFRIPYVENRSRATACFGDAATLTLIRMMILDGSKAKHLQAQIFGGAHDREVCSRDIGRENTIVARRVLSRQRVRIISEDVGGEKGRKVVYNTYTNETAVLKVEKLRKSDWYPYENSR